MNLSFDRVTKHYGPVIGLNDVTLHTEPGILGLLGANGAGKTTLIKLATGQLRPDEGSVRLAPHDAWSLAAKRQLGYCPDLHQLYDDLSVREFVFFCARLHGYSQREARERTEHALGEVAMQDRAHRRLGGCSHGMRQRAKLAQAIVHDPPVLLLDEPLNGIDPGGRREFQVLLRGLAERGKTIVVSSHLLDELEQVVDTIALLVRGRLIARGSLAEVRSRLANRPLVVELESSRARELAARLVAAPSVVAVELQRETVRVTTTQSLELWRLVNQLGAEPAWDLRRLESLDQGAEAVFEQLSGGAS